MSAYIVKLPNGDHQLGGDIEGVFVPFVTYSAGKVAQHVERAHTLHERAEAGDERARDQIGEKVSGGKSSGGKSSGAEKAS